MEPITLNIPAMALRGLAVFPHMTLTFDVERQISIAALERAMEADQEIFLVTQREIGDAQLVEGVEHSVLASAVLHAEVLLVANLVVVVQGRHHSEAEAHIDEVHSHLLRGILGIGDDARATVADNDVGVGVKHRHLHHTTLRAIPSLFLGGRGDDSIGVVALFSVQFEGPVLSNAERVLVELLVVATDVL